MAILFPDVSVIEVQNDALLVEQVAEVDVLTESVEVAAFEVTNEVTDLLSEGIQGPPGAPSSGSGDSTVYDQRSELVSEALVYRAEAVPGTDDAEPKWRIRRISIAINGAQISASTQYANGSSAFVHQWTQRGSYDYV